MASALKRRTLINLVQSLFFLGLGIWIIYRMFYLMSPGDRQDMVDSIRQTRLTYLIPILIAGFLSHFFRAARWNLLLRPLDIHPRLTNTTLAVLIGYLVNLILPRMGEIAKCTVLARYERVPADKMVGTIVAERAFDLVSLLFICLLALALQAAVIGEFALEILGALASRKWILLAGISLLGFLIVLAIFLVRRKAGGRIAQFLLGILTGIGALFRMKTRGPFLLYSVLIWAMYLSQVYLGFLALPPTDHLNVLAALVVLIFGSLGMILTPGGLGAYPALIAEILIYYGISGPDGKAFGWVSWSVQTGIVILLGLAAFLALPLYNRYLHQKKQAYGNDRLGEEQDRLR